MTVSPRGSLGGYETFKSATGWPTTSHQRLAELMKQVPDVLARIMAEKYRLDRISSIATGELTFNNSWVILSILSGV